MNPDAERVAYETDPLVRALTDEHFGGGWCDEDGIAHQGPTIGGVKKAIAVAETVRRVAAGLLQTEGTDPRDVPFPDAEPDRRVVVVPRAEWEELKGRADPLHDARAADLRELRANAVAIELIPWIEDEATRYAVAADIVDAVGIEAQPT